MALAVVLKLLAVAQGIHALQHLPTAVVACTCNAAFRALFKHGQALGIELVFSARTAAVHGNVGGRAMNIPFKPVVVGGLAAHGVAPLAHAAGVFARLLPFKVNVVTAF